MRYKTQKGKIMKNGKIKNPKQVELPEDIRSSINPNEDDKPCLDFAAYGVAIIEYKIDDESRTTS